MANAFQPNRKILVTSALPYANGSIHIGHLVEYIQTDIWVRFQKIRGHTCHYMCADDTHGTAIMLSAKKEGVSPEQLIQRVHQEHIEDFKAFSIDFDYYYTTDSEENRVLSEFIFTRAREKGAIYEKSISQLFCTKCSLFLPDRFIRGKCPRCGAVDQYGDNCEKCAATYEPSALIEPRCAECGSAPQQKETRHFFFALSQFENHIKEWLSQDPVQKEIKNKLDEWFREGLRDWDITRDAPYFGFKIPGTQDKYFYVWLDAPVGYLATTQKWCSEHGISFDTIWRSNEYEIHHFIGKDILYFHTLFWPAMLKVSDFMLPKSVRVHGFLTVNGEKMSKSRGTFITAKTYLQHLNPEYLRYYYASKLSPSIEDLDLNLEDFVFKVNADVVNKFINIGSRLGSILNKKLNGLLTEPNHEGKNLLNTLVKHIPSIENGYETLEYSKTLREIIGLADDLNKYINDAKPWELVSSDAEKAARVCTTGLNGLRILAGMLKPVLPHIVKGVESFLNIPPLQWNDLNSIITHHPINPYQHLAHRVDAETFKKMVTLS